MLILSKKILAAISCIGTFSVFALLSACSNSETESTDTPTIPETTDSSATEAYSLKGMVQIFSSGNKVTLGTNLESAPATAKPQMESVFTYDFLIGQHEVTCKEYGEFAHTSCKDTLSPIVNVTFYDAVLFANNRSKAEHFDTAYTYSSAEFDENGNCTNLAGFVFHPEKKAYRLPTETEWVYVASQNWDPSKGWNSQNSDMEIHDVCTAEDVVQDSLPCDMAGNAMEWVNDWLDYFRDTTLTNFVGAPEGSLAQRVVKGGSFRISAESTKLYSRSDTYLVTSATKANYVGFRLAFGAIPNAIWMGSSGEAVSSRIVTLATNSIIRDITGTYKTKLVFRNDITGNLVLINYFNGALTIDEIRDTINSFHPDISPDGKRVAFCTGIEGIDTHTELYVRDLNSQGSNLVKLEVPNAAIPRWQVTPSGDTVIVYVSSSKNNKNEAQFKNESTWQVPFANGQFGAPQKLFDGAYHGGVSSNRELAVSGSQLLRARTHSKDTLWYNAEQACNASLANDNSNRTLFLDFGSKTGIQFVGEKYQTHQQMLIVDSTGKLIQHIAAPAGYEFDHTEWAKQTHAEKGNLVVAALSNAEGTHAQIALVNLDDKSITPLAEGDELWHPCLWVSELPPRPENSPLDFDSAGIYLSENYNTAGLFNRIKMEVFWKNIEDAEVVIVGGSRVERGIAPKLYPEKKMVNMSVEGIDANRDKYFIENYVFNVVKNLKAVVISLDLDHWTTIEDFLTLVLMAGPGYVYDANHNFWKDSVPEGFVEAVENGYPAIAGLAELYSDKGDYCSWLSDTSIEINGDSTFGELQQSNHSYNLMLLENLIQSAAQRGVYLIGIIFPQSPQYKETEIFGRYGLKRSVAEEDIKWMQELAQKNPNFILMDENKMGDHDYPGEMAENADHLNCLGAQKLTSKLNDVLDSLYSK